MAIKDQTLIQDLQIGIEGKDIQVAAYKVLLQRAVDEIKRLRKLAGCVNGVVDFVEVRKIAQPAEWFPDNMRFERTDQ